MLVGWYRMVSGRCKLVDLDGWLDGWLDGVTWMDGGFRLVG